MKAPVLFISHAVLTFAIEPGLVLGWSWKNWVNAWPESGLFW